MIYFNMHVLMYPINFCLFFLSLSIVNIIIVVDFIIIQFFIIVKFKIRMG
jgi:hypothetical protein